MGDCVLAMSRDLRPCGNYWNIGAISADATEGARGQCQDEGSGSSLDGPWRPALRKSAAALSRAPTVAISLPLLIDAVPRPA